ncbi:hypothetical protein K469DRAFT_752105 [Zopfia rhizophila CBS 207.26]|uniref:FAD-binding domain-containing protein n=1 Tax=Zopfia rhizophila CBS 207.26 TaxID=1314779 RepID=A0A6A6DSM5_9PEZI|nr:hypothetical protein K469DRAFT_752105 [Zopfia rhizophila CBS 207.26]
MDCGSVYGLAWLGGEVLTPLPELIRKQKAWVVSPSQRGYFCYFSGGPTSENKVMWLSIYREKNPSVKQNLRADLRNRYKDWTDPTMQDIIAKADPKYIHRISTMPELPEWGRNGIVLIGDAAHGMSPTSGQGASQALEDAQTFSLLLAQSLIECYSAQPQRLINVSEQLAIAAAIRALSTIRRPRVRRIAALGRLLDTHLPCATLLLRILRLLPFIRNCYRLFNKRLSQWDVNKEVRRVVEADLLTSDQ